MPREWLEQWLATCKTYNQSKHTLDAYRRDVTSFLDFCEKKHIQLANIEASDLREYLTYKVEHMHLASSTLQRHLSAIRQFMKWTKENNFLMQNVIEDFQLKRQPRRLPGMIDAETVIQILDQPAPQKESEQPLWLRDKAILELLYSSGLRLAEVQNITFKDIDFERKLLRIVGKGNKTRIIPFGEKAKSALLTWFKVYQLWKKDIVADQPIFISKRGGVLTPRQIENRVKLQAQRAGVNVDLHPHLLRHCFASHMLSASGDLRAVQELLGHTSLSTTQIYTHLDFARLAQTYDKSHPRAQKKINSV